MKWFIQGNADPLKGKWIVDPADTQAVAEFGQVELDFSRGRLTYEVSLPDKKQIMLMTYRIEGDFVVTDQPSHPQPERTKFRIEGNKLTLAFGGTTGNFLRA
jgi:hypothetical protein